MTKCSFLCGRLTLSQSRGPHYTNLSTPNALILVILQYLGINHGAIALTKTDLVHDYSDRLAELREWLAGSSLEDAPIVPTSIVDGRGLPQLKDALADMLAKTPVQADAGKPRLAVDRILTQQGIGTVVTGTLTGGSLQVGQEIVVQPENLATRIRTLQTHNLATEKVLPGTRSALSLASDEIADKNHRGIARVDVVTCANLGNPTDTVDVWLTRSQRESIQAKPARHASKIHFHHGSAHQAATVYFIDSDQLNPGESSLAQIRLAQPMFLFVGDRFLLRNSATLLNAINLLLVRAVISLKFSS